MERTYSQKVARGFEIIGYVLLLPTFLGLLCSGFALLIGLMNGKTETAVYGLLFIVMIGVGVVLLMGYARHSCGRLADQRISALWIVTIIYNGLLFLASLYPMADALQSRKNFISDMNPTGLLIALSISSAYFSAIYFAMKAYSFEKRKKLY